MTEQSWNLDPRHMPAVVYSVFLVHTLELLNLSGFKWPHIWESHQGRWYLLLQCSQ